MKTFKELTNSLDENSIVYGSSAIYASKVSNLANRIKREKSPQKRDELIALQNKYIAWMNGVGISLIAKEIKGIKRQ